MNRVRLAFPLSTFPSYLRFSKVLGVLFADAPLLHVAEVGLSPWGEANLCTEVPLLAEVWRGSWDKAGLVCTEV